MFRFTPVVTYLIVINIVLLLAGETIFHGISDFMALHYPASQNFAIYQYFSYMFMHGGFNHLLSNMFGLLVFGPLLEEFWGPKRFLTYYLLCGVGAGLLYTGYQYYDMHGIMAAKDLFLQHPTPDNFANFFYDYGREFYSDNLSWIDTFREQPNNTYFIEQAKDILVKYYNSTINMPMVGASGALFGILIAFAMLFPNTELIFFPLFIPIKAKYVVAGYALIEYFSVIRNAPGDNVAHIAHLSGMLVGFIIVKVWQKQRGRFY